MDLRRKKKIIILSGLVTLLFLASYQISNYINKTNKPPPNFGKSNIDQFGVTEIYPTKVGGREWYVNTNDPNADEIFDTGSPIKIQPDGSWQIGTDTNSKLQNQIRMSVGTPNGMEEWKNVEITGYAKVLKDMGSGDSLVWYARGGKHSNDSPCEGTSLKSGIDVDGIASWKKEIWHTGGYTDESGKQKVTSSIIGKWIGWKAVIYNINHDEWVKMESYIDDKHNNHWSEVTEVIDNGNWFANSPDIIFNSARCNKPKNYIINESGPEVTFRSDNLVWNFKNLSVREIRAP